MSLRDELLKASEESIKETDKLLEDEFNTLMRATKIDLEALRPKVKDKTTYDKFLSIVDEATQNNLTLAALQERLESLGTEAVQVGKKIAKLLTI